MMWERTLFSLPHFANSERELEGMETIRDQVHEFTRACLALTGFSHAHKGLTDLEREVVRKSLQALEEEIGLVSPEPSADAPPLAATFTNMPPID